MSTPTHYAELLHALREGDAATVSAYLGSRLIEANQPLDPDGNRALHLACIAFGAAMARGVSTIGHNGCITALLSAGADPWRENAAGQTPMQVSLSAPPVLRQRIAGEVESRFAGDFRPGRGGRGRSRIDHPVGRGVHRSRPAHPGPRAGSTLDDDLEESARRWCERHRDELVFAA